MIYIFVITFIGLYLRYLPRNFASDDMQSFLIPWFQYIKLNGGFTILNQQVGDYGLLYQTIIAAFSYSDVNPIYLYKAFSTLFDFLLAGTAAYFISQADKERSYQNGTGDRTHIVYAYVLLLPTVIMNSAFWGQCDSIYTFFLLWSLWFLNKERYGLSFFMLGCSLAFKLQSILMMPVFLCFWIRKRFSVFNFLITVLTFWFSGIIAYVHGRGLLDGFSIYLFQVGEFKRMWMNVPSIWFFFEVNYEKYHILAIGLTLVVLIIILLLLFKNDIPVTSFEQLFAFAFLVDWTSIIFLPSMHERYTYVMDILVLLLMFLNKSFIKYAIITIGTSCITYIVYLFVGHNITSFFAFVYTAFIFLHIAAWLHFIYFFCLGLSGGQKNSNPCKNTKNKVI